MSVADMWTLDEEIALRPHRARVNNYYLTKELSQENDMNKSFTQQEIYDILKSVRLDYEEQTGERMFESDCALLSSISDKFGLSEEQALEITGEDVSPGVNNLEHELNSLIMARGLKVIEMSKEERLERERMHHEAQEKMAELHQQEWLKQIKSDLGLHRPGGGQ